MEAKPRGEGLIVLNEIRQQSVTADAIKLV